MNLITAIQSVPDYRKPRGKRHQLWVILTIVLLGSCTGYWGYKPLTEFTKNHRQLLLELLDLPETIKFPSYSTFRNVILELDFNILADLFNIWAKDKLKITPGELMSIDGKGIKSTLVGGNSSYQNFVNVVSVYSHRQGWVVRQGVMENNQESEIEVVAQLVQELSGCQIVITADALHCQKKRLS
jgi:hypothetical protein